MFLEWLLATCSCKVVYIIHTYLCVYKSRWFMLFPTHFVLLYATFFSQALQWWYCCRVQGSWVVLVFLRERGTYAVCLQNILKGKRYKWISWVQYGANITPHYNFLGSKVTSKKFKYSHAHVSELRLKLSTSCYRGSRVHILVTEYDIHI